MVLNPPPGEGVGMPTSKCSENESIIAREPACLFLLSQSWLAANGISSSSASKSKSKGKRARFASSLWRSAPFSLLFPEPCVSVVYDIPSPIQLNSNREPDGPVPSPDLLVQSSPESAVPPTAAAPTALPRRERPRPTRIAAFRYRQQCLSHLPRQPCGRFWGI